MLITTTQLSDRTGLSRATIWRYRRRFADFPKPILIAGSSVLRWCVDEVDAWILAHRVPTTSARAKG